MKQNMNTSTASSSASIEMTTEEVARRIVESTKRSSLRFDRSKNKRKSQRSSDTGTNNKNRSDNDEEEDDDGNNNAVYTGDTSWGEVCRACFVHSSSQWVSIICSLVMLLGCLYLFGLGLDLLGSGAKVLAGCAAGQLFGSSVNPVAGVMVGILATVLLQSSSTTTSIIVGLVGADDSVFTVDQGIYMIMGANIGTTITNTIVALLQFQNQNQLADAFAGATMHDIFNFLTVAVLLPLEVATGYLNHLTEALVRGANTEKGDKWEGPVKKLISPLGKKILIANKGVTNAVAGGGNCEDFYPIMCEDPDDPTYSTCDTGLIGCDKGTDSCPAFFDPNAGVVEDQSAGLVVLCMGLFLIFIALIVLVQVMTRLLTGVSIRIIHKATDLNGYLLILIGTGITTLLQSSSTTTSFLTPVVGIGALRLEQMYPLTIGANVGTTISAVLAALVTDGNAALQVALAHLMFNITGMMIWYPILPLQGIPIMFARRLGQYARVWRPFTLLYVFGAFFLMPLVCLGLSSLFLKEQKAFTVLGSLLTALLGLLLVFWIRWCYFLGGRAKFYKYLSQKHKRYIALQTLTTDIERIKKQIEYHSEYAGIPILTALHDDPRKSFTGNNNPEEPAPSGRSNGKAGENRRASSGNDIEAYAERKEKYDKLVQEALSTVAQDMEYLKAGLAVLNHHTGLLRDIDAHDDGSTSSDNENEDTNKEGDDGGDEAAAAPSSTGLHSKSLREEKVTMAGLWEVVPKIYVAAVIAASILVIWGIIALFKHGGKASIGAAYFLIAVFVISIVWGGAVFNPNYLHEYFRNLDSEKRRETIQNLPRDMKQLQAQLKKLLQHYKLLDLEEALGSRSHDTSTDSVQYNSSDQ